ncbi:hypothetical protein [Streptomyces sp. ISL-100]|uniref:hypothetical protein n=1 Tax=Streptomyces sp. ISL-100 TaxID=2819173 RepID=UPI001BE7C4E7|nr:hypothetical protein [Streptomyces sp. ISL-100]MBT2399351.1 hypothetical protein [Streptomyces sp. ISL-100]
MAGQQVEVPEQEGGERSYFPHRCGDRPEARDHARPGGEHADHHGADGRGLLIEEEPEVPAAADPLAAAGHRRSEDVLDLPVQAGEFREGRREAVSACSAQPSGGRRRLRCVRRRPAAVGRAL